jgi:hypothetical protein
VLCSPSMCRARNHVGSNADFMLARSPSCPGPPTRAGVGGAMAPPPVASATRVRKVAQSTLSARAGFSLGILLAQFRLLIPSLFAGHWGINAQQIPSVVRAKHRSHRCGKGTPWPAGAVVCALLGERERQVCVCLPPPLPASFADRRAGGAPFGRHREHAFFYCRGSCVRAWLASGLSGYAATVAATVESIVCVLGLEKEK